MPRQGWAEGSVPPSGESDSGVTRVASSLGKDNMFSVARCCDFVLRGPSSPGLDLAQDGAPGVDSSTTVWNELVGSVRAPHFPDAAPDRPCGAQRSASTLEQRVSI
jgi:hypothetical protein